MVWGGGGGRGGVSIADLYSSSMAPIPTGPRACPPPPLPMKKKTVCCTTACSGVQCTQGTECGERRAPLKSACLQSLLDMPFSNLMACLLDNRICCLLLFDRGSAGVYFATVCGSKGKQSCQELWPFGQGKLTCAKGPVLFVTCLQHPPGGPPLPGRAPSPLLGLRRSG